MTSIRGTTLRPVGLQEIAWLHDIRHQTVYKWSSPRHILPAPDCVVSGKDIWLDVGVIEEWSRQTGRYAPAIARWAAHLELPVGEVSFVSLYDLLLLGREKTRVGEVGLPTVRAGGK